MVENLIISFNTVMSMFVIIAMGYWLKRKGWIYSNTHLQLNVIVFRVFIPIFLINNIYHMDFFIEFQLELLIFAVVSSIAMWLLLTVFVIFIEKRPTKRGAMIQGMYRSNYTLLGLTLLANLYGENNLGIPSLLLAVLVPLFNVMAVITLGTFRGGKVTVGKISKEIVKNPFVIAVTIGVILSLTKLKLPVLIENTLTSISEMAMPIALIAMGASLSFEKVFKDKKNLFIMVIGKLIVVPIIFVPVATFFNFRGIELASLMVVFASPTAVVSYTMADQMNSDAELASAAIILSTVLSCITMFLWIFALKEYGFI